jgi:hypothetical protein
VDQAGEQLRIRAAATGLPEKTDHGLTGSSTVDIELREQIVRERQLGIQLERASECRHSGPDASWALTKAGDRLRFETPPVTDYEVIVLV